MGGPDMGVCIQLVRDCVFCLCFSECNPGRGPELLRNASEGVSQEQASICESDEKFEGLCKTRACALRALETGAGLTSLLPVPSISPVAPRRVRNSNVLPTAADWEVGESGPMSPCLSG